MTREDMQRVAATLKCVVGFRTHPPRIGTGAVVVDVRIWRKGDSCLRRGLGRFEELAAMSEAELRAAMVAAFVPKP